MRDRAFRMKRSRRDSEVDARNWCRMISCTGREDIEKLSRHCMSHKVSGLRHAKSIARRSKLLDRSSES